MPTQLPTFSSGSWTVTSLLDSVLHELASDTSAGDLRLFAYAVTQSGWNELREAIIHWSKTKGEKSLTAYVGTDHALTDPDAVRHIRDDGVTVRLMINYSGIFHPKVLWLNGKNAQKVWVGSNNVTRDGLCHNIEFATLVIAKDTIPSLEQWFTNVDAASEPLTDDLLTSYEEERNDFAKRRSETGTFTWSRKSEPPIPTPKATTLKSSKRSSGKVIPGATGDLVIEIMPRETGLDGKQVQLPKEAAVRFFGVNNRVGASKNVTLVPVGTTASRQLRLSIFANNTARLSINELGYRDRPCVVVFHRTKPDSYSFDIVPQSIFPGRYRGLLSRCVNQTRSGSRKWAIL